MRLIDADALKKAICIDEIISIDETWEQLYDAVVKAIDTAPAYNISGNEYFPYRTAYFNGVKDGQAIARPKGEWKDEGGFVFCNQCGMSHGVHKTNYCPNCGAEMRKELPKPDPKKLSPHHDTYRDALFDEALDELERKERGSGE